MKVFSVLLTVLVLLCASPFLWGQANLDQIRQMEISGDRAGARTALAQAAQNNPNNVPVLTAYAEYLERHGDPGARQAYDKLLTAVKASGDSAKVAAVSRRIQILELLAGDGAGHTDKMQAAAEPWPTVAIPGPMRSFSRMAAISPDALPEEVLPALARNVVTNGYEASHSNEALEQTEYLKLVHR